MPGMTTRAVSTPSITVSVVSHRQNALVNTFLGDVARLAGNDISIVVTENVSDEIPLAIESATVARMIPRFLSPVPET